MIPAAVENRRHPVVSQRRFGKRSRFRVHAAEIPVLSLFSITSLPYDEPVKRFLLVLLFAVLMAPTSSHSEDQYPPLPNLVLYGGDGVTLVDLEHFDGCAVLLTFWASYCGPCRVELPELKALEEELRYEGFVLVPVNMDGSKMNAQRFLEQIGLDLPLFRMDPEDLEFLRVRRLPTSILLDQERRPVRVFQGYSKGMTEDLRSTVEGILGAREKRRGVDAD